MADPISIEPFHRMNNKVDELAAQVRHLSNLGGGGTSGGMSDDWKESVDRQLTQLHGDVRALLNRGVVAVVALAAMIAGLYLYFNEKFEKVSDRLAAVERKVDSMDERLSGKLDLLIERKERDAKP